MRILIVPFLGKREIDGRREGGTAGSKSEKRQRRKGRGRGKQREERETEGEEARTKMGIAYISRWDVRGVEGAKFGWVQGNWRQLELHLL